MNHPEDQNSSYTPLPSLSILIVDDQPANLRAFESVIGPLGYTVLLAESGPKALELVAEIRFSLILLDVRMPLMDGLEIAARIRQTELGRSTPILFVSAHEDTEIEISRSGLHGMLDFIYSPVTSEVLIWKVQTWMAFTLKREMLRRQAARVLTTQSDLHQLIEMTPIPEREARLADSRLNSSIQNLMHSLSDRLGVSV